MPSPSARKSRLWRPNWPSFSYSASTKPSTSLPAKNPNGIREMAQTQTSRRPSANSALALPRSDIGLHASVRIVYLWVVAALSLPNIQNYLSGFMRLGISTSGISNLLIRVATILEPVAEEILRDVRQGFHVWADETGWRVRGINWWLWAFANETSAYYYRAPHPGSPVVVQIL